MSIGLEGNWPATSAIFSFSSSCILDAFVTFDDELDAEEAIKDLFSMSATRYYQVLNALVDRPEALAADPMLVKRLRRLRASRQKARAARRLGFDVP